MIIKLFSTPILLEKLEPTVFNEIFNIVKDYSDNELCIKKRANWACDIATTYADGNIFDNDKFKPVEQILLKYVDSYLKQNNIKYNLSQFWLQGWLNYANKNQYQEIHLHSSPGIMLSGTLYISADPTTGNFYIPNPNISDIYFTQLESDDEDWCARYHISPVPGSIVIFPSYMNHGVENNNSDLTRISLSFNAHFINNNV